MTIDLRSDTVTKPGPDMRRAMAEAEVGDDVFGEDPTVIRLQEKSARLLGKEAALFVPSGTMANQVSLRTLTRPGDEVICEATAHVYRFEGGAGAALSGLSYFPLQGSKGLIDAHMVETALQPPENPHCPLSRVLAIENTANFGGGTVYGLDEIHRMAETVKKAGLAMHLDGARMFHACLAGGYTAEQLAEPFDTVSFCLSKGLGAPVGSMIVSTAGRIKLALRYRKQFGGGMRQAGILAAAGLFALEHNLPRLEEDHLKAQKLAHGLASMKGVELDPGSVLSNLVIFSVEPSGLAPAEVCARLKEQGVGVLPFGGPHSIRACTHLDVSMDDIHRAVDIMAGILDHAA